MIAEQTYDFIMAGGGAAGLSLALALVNSPLQASSILIIEREAKQRNDRTWCFWTDRPEPYDDIVACTWEMLDFIAPQF